MTDDPAPPCRRPRYRGTHPRRFAQRYKELDPARFPAERDKAAARGHTPAGSHRPIMVDEVVARLAAAPGDAVLDCTLGWGGHARAILARLLPGGRLVGLDLDPVELPRCVARLRAEGYNEDVFQARRMSFAGLPALVAERGRFDAVLADLGVSSMQLDDPRRGFTFKDDGPLDLRFNPRRGRSAAELLAAVSETALAELLASNADEPFARAIARAVATARAPVVTTRQLADVVRATLAEARHGRTAAATRASLQRCFQALRIAVNDELVALDQLLAHLPAALKPGGRVVILSFHSGEDRRVKQALRDGHRAGVYAAIAPTPERPSPDEQRANPRSAPAKLRWAVRAG